MLIVRIPEKHRKERRKELLRLTGYAISCLVILADDVLLIVRQPPWPYWAAFTAVWIWWLWASRTGQDL